MVKLFKPEIVDHKSPTVEMKLQVPRGLIEFLQVMQKLGGSEPKTHLEQILTRELDYFLGELPRRLVDVNYIKFHYGEGSHVTVEALVP